MCARILILAYHHVGTPPPGFRRRKLWVTPDLLALHVRLVRRLGDELRAMAAAGWEIGSHSSVHRRLARVPVEEQRTMLARSREAIAREIGAAPRTVAYPYGSYSAGTAAVARGPRF